MKTESEIEEMEQKLKDRCDELNQQLIVAPDDQVSGIQQELEQIAVKLRTLHWVRAET